MTVKDAILRNAGVKLSKDGKSVFNYNPLKYSAGINWALALTVMPALITRGLVIQMFFLFGLMHFWIWVVCPSDVELDTLIPKVWHEIAGLAQFVLGMFVSLTIAHTYYSNREMFGTVFGRSMGLAQMVAAWIKAPEATPKAATQADDARKLIVRWVNASFRLMWLETGVLETADEIGQDMIGSGLMTEAEWYHVAGLESRCTHIYQWMNNVLVELMEAGYIRDTILLNRMNGQIDDMRAANVWGLPSVPIAYVTIITIMVKMHLTMTAIFFGSVVRTLLDKDATWVAVLLPHFGMAMQSFLYQGLLDLHGLLYNPNQGLLLGHMPVVNFLAFVRNVTEALLTDSSIDGANLPYKLNLSDAEPTSGTLLREGPSVQDRDHPNSHEKTARKLSSDSVEPLRAPLLVGEVASDEEPTGLSCRLRASFGTGTHSYPQMAAVPESELTPR